MASANTHGFHLVRCPMCLNVLPEPANVTVYKCGGCGTTLRAKICASNGHHVATKQVRQDSDNYSVATCVSNGVPPQNKDQASSGAATDGSCIADAPSTEHDSNSTKSSVNGDVMLAEKNSVEVQSTVSKDYRNFEGQDTNSRMEGPADLTHPNTNDTYIDSGEAESHAVEQSAENAETCRVREDDTECRKEAFSMQDSEHKGASEAEHSANKKSYLVRVQPRSCDLQASGNSPDFHSKRTSLQSKSFRSSEPLQSNIMHKVDELRGDLSELFEKNGKPSDCKPRAYPPRHPKQDGYMSRVAITSNAPLAAYHPAAKHSGHAALLTRSGQVAPRGLPSPRYRRHWAYSCYHDEQMEMRPCRPECCHSCRPPCYRSCKQEPAMHKPLAKEIKRRPPPRHHCRPVLRGAPFVICSNCLRLVQLPTDFAVPSRGTRRLQCGSCSEFLSYSYRDPSGKKLQSPFGGDEYSTDGYEIHQVADGQHNGGFHEAEADPVSYSEEYGLSFGVSHSTSTEDGQPLYVSRNSSFNTIDEKMAKDGEHLLQEHDRKGKGLCVAQGDSGELDSAVKRPKGRSVGLQLQGILKKGPWDGIPEAQVVSMLDGFVRKG